MSPFAVSLAIAALLAGQPPAATAQPTRAVDAFKAEAAAYVMRLAGRPTDKLVVENEAALRWDNPARTGEDGALFIWTLGGRPEVVGTIFTYRLGDKINRKHEYHSLATGPLSAEFRGREVWAPSKAGVIFQTLGGALPPAGNARQRLTQMKALARDFSASMTEAEGQQYQLRLLSQPLIRYEPADKQIQDGALFSFSLGTDPEVLLLLESRLRKGAYEWQFALARFHYIELKVAYQGKTVWEVPALPKIANLDLGAAEYRDSVYATYHVERGIPLEAAP